MSELFKVETLHIEDEVFKKMRMDADQVLQKLLKNMAEKGSLEGRLTITLDLSFTEEMVQNRDPDIEGETRIVHTPKFQHKVGSVLQIKNEQKGDMNCDGMEMVWDDEKGEYVLRPITGRDQMSIFDMEVVRSEQAEEVVDGEILEGRKIAALPGPTNDDEEQDASEGQSEDNPADEDVSEDAEDMSDEFGNGYDYQNPEDF